MKRWGLSLFAMSVAAILSVGLPHTAWADTTSGSSGYAGGVFVTGHDPDFHAYLGDSYETQGARNIIRKAIGYVTNNKVNPKVLLVSDPRNPGSGYSDPRLGMTAAGYTYDKADYGSNLSGWYDLHTVNFSNYDVVVVASDFGGWLRQDELNILNARSSELMNYVNNGGGLVAFAESGGLTTSNRFGFLPFLVTAKALGESEAGDTVTSVGTAMGLVNGDVDSNVSHNIFTGTGGMDIVDQDSHGNIMSLVTKKPITPTGIDNPPTVTATADRAPNANGWYNNDVTVSFTATDTDSTGVVHTDGSVVVSTEGAGQVIKGSATDSGNFTGWGSLTINLDKTAPVTTVALSGTPSPIGAGKYTAPVTVSLSATDALSGVAKTEYQINGGAWQTYTGPISVSDLGDYTVAYRSTDKADNVEAAQTTSFSIVPSDITPPVTTAEVDPVSGNGGSSPFNTPVTVTLQATDDLSGVAKTEYSVNGGSWQTYTGAIPVSDEGAYTVDFRSTDNAGNVEATKSISFVIDKTPPVTTVNLPQPTGTNGWYTSAVTIPMNCTDNLSGVAKTEYRINGGDWITYTGPVTISQDGNYTIDYRSTDNAGNVEATQTTSVKIDQTAPVVTATLPQPTGNNGWYTTNVPITFSGTDNLSGLSSIQYRINGGAWQTYTGSFTAIHDGLCTIEYRGTDGAGNTSNPVPIVLQIDKTPPTLSIQLDKTVLWPPNHKMVPINVTINASDAGSGIDSVSLVSITENQPVNGLGDGNTSTDIQGADYGTADTQFYVLEERSGTIGTDRVYTVTYKAVDKAGNVTFATATITVPHDMSGKNA